MTMAEAKDLCCVNVELYEKGEGKLGKLNEISINASDSLDKPLQEILYKVLSQEWPGVDLSNIKCLTGNIRGEFINLHCKLNEVSYISDMFHKKKIPTLIILKESSSPIPPKSPDNLEPQKVGRTLSNLIRGMIGSIHDPVPLDDYWNWNTLVESDQEALSSPPPVSIEIQNPSSPSGGSSTDSSPSKMRRKVKPLSKKDRAISLNTTYPTSGHSDDLMVGSTIKMEVNKRKYKTLSRDNRTISLKDTHYTPTAVDFEEEEDEIFKEDSPPRPRGTVINGSTRRGRLTSDEKLTLQKRNTMFFFSSKSKEEEPEENAMEISSPEQQHFDWRKRQKGAVRTTRKGNQNRPKKKEKNVMPDLSYSSFEVHKITIQPEELPSFEVECREFQTVGELKKLIQNVLKRKSLVLSNYNNEEHSDIVLTYSIDGAVYELYNERQLIYKTMLYKCWQKDGNVSIPVNVELKETNWELSTVLRISKLTGVLLDENVTYSVGKPELSTFVHIAANDRKEVEWTRRTLNSFVNEIVRNRNDLDYTLSMELETDEAPMLLALQTPLDNKIEITFHYKNVFSLVRRINVNEKVLNILQSVFPCVVACGLVDNNIEKYTLQMTGEHSYLDGDNELIAFKDIRKSILKAEPVHLSICVKPTIEQDFTCKFNWLPIDPYSNVPPLHTDISRIQKNESVHEIFAASVWDQKDEFALAVTQISNLPVPTTRDTKKLNVIVTAAIYHANQQLKNKIQTQPHQLNSEGKIELHETLMFDILTMNLPKAAKILVCVSDSPHKDKQKLHNVLYWGLVPVFDHRGILQSGAYTMNLWKGPTANNKLNFNDTISFDINPCAPCNNNPDPCAVQVLIQFPRYTYPVFFPSSAPETCSFLLSQENDSKVNKKLESLLTCLVEGKLPMSAFPSYVARIDCTRLQHVIEMYSLLQQIEANQTLPVETALKLLDGEFADENVRSFAVHVLETLPNDRLENILLQLTQALKFEPCHDSALSRLLLKRALTNKRIGHFFFWYLKCEMYNPLFTPRFAVLLEAYLKGCGEAMLQKFESQVELQMQLEEIGKIVEKSGGNDASKMQAILQDLLKKHNFTEKVLTPVYNPRLSLGRLNPSKCKIMTSKKRPHWLEMCNVDPTALRPTPTRLILKLGDDLRQDVIVLRMLSLFEKLWEKEGLPDLCLIPYGCMATGPTSGFIEVVKNARTIADVSGINDNRKLYEWIKSHQKNEFGEDDPDLLKAAIKRFAYSCAGYTVASYVLGIGDRHNDNVMITTSGNLFHIDFGHFLGNIKYFLGVKREWAPFVLTPDFVYVMGGENSDIFNTYKNLCCRAFLCLRRHSELIFNLFSLMKSTGIPELACIEDAQYIHDALMVRSTEHDAEQNFQQLIKKCLDLQWTVQIMWWIHKRRGGGNSS